MSTPDPKPGVSGKKVVVWFVILGVLFIAIWSLLAIFVLTKQSIVPPPQEKVGPK